MKIAGEHRVVHLFEGCDVIEYPDRAAVGAQDKVVIAWMDQDVVNRHGRQVEFDLRPVSTLVPRGKKSKFSADKQEVGVPGMFADHVDDAIVLRQVRRDGLPRLAKVGRRINIDLKVAHSVAIKSHIGRASR